MIQTAIFAAMLTQPAYADVRNFNIPAQPAESAIGVFARQSGTQILASKVQLRGKRTNAVTGKLEVETALRQLFSGTGLVAKQRAGGGGIITVQLAAPAVPNSHEVWLLPVAEVRMRVLT